MPPSPRTPLADLDTPQLLPDLDVLDRNLAHMQDACPRHRQDLRGHLQSLKCGGGAPPLPERGGARVPPPLADLDTPQLLLDLDVLDRNLAHMQDACRRHGKDLRVHFKSLKCGGLARYLKERGAAAFLCAKLNEAEVLADAGVTDVFVAN